MNKCPVCHNNATYVYCSLSCSNRDRVRKNELIYNANPKKCMECSNPIPYSKRHTNVFCSNSCAASRNNRLHPKRMKQEKLPKPDVTLSRFLAGQVDQRATLRKLLIRVRGNACAICTLSGIWCGKPITLIVDHKDGDAGNNLPDNVRLLCPNCNSQTPTFSGRNRGKGRKSRGLAR
jgi:hypothetical protein